MNSLIEKFYSSFNNLDAEAMASCYHPDVEFQDPAFGKLSKQRASHMWRMLCKSQEGQDFTVIYSNVKSENNTGSAKWEAIYHFSKTNRKVHNKISAEFEFKDGLIIKHTDTFNLYSWSKQALGLSGILIGWTPFFQRKLNSQTNHLLDRFIEKKNLPSH